MRALREPEWLERPRRIEPPGRENRFRWPVLFHRRERAQAAWIPVQRFDRTDERALARACVRDIRGIDGEVFEDPQRLFGPGFEAVLQVGKRNFARVRLVRG